LKKTELPRAPDPQLLLARLDELRAALRAREPFELAERTGAVFHPNSQGGGEFALPMWEQPMYITFPQFEVRDAAGREAGIASQALTLYHFHTSDGAAPGEGFIAFSDLPDGRFYAQAFQGYTGYELARRFPQRRDFEQAALRLGGALYPHGESAFLFNLFPRVKLLVVYWQGDEDLPSSCQVLFNSAIAHHLPTDACAIAGSILTRRLLAAR